MPGSCVAPKGPVVHLAHDKMSPVWRLLPCIKQHFCPLFWGFRFTLPASGPVPGPVGHQCTVGHSELVSDRPGLREPHPRVRGLGWSQRRSQGQFF